MEGALQVTKKTFEMLKYYRDTKKVMETIKCIIMYTVCEGVKSHKVM